MRIRLTLSFDITRNRADDPPAERMPEIFESSGSLVKQSPQPRYVGFVPEE